MLAESVLYEALRDAENPWVAGGQWWPEGSGASTAQQQRGAIDNRSWRRCRVPVSMSLVATHRAPADSPGQRVLRLCVVASLITECSFGLLAIRFNPPGRVIAAFYAVIALVALWVLLGSAGFATRNQIARDGKEKVRDFLVYCMVIAAGGAILIGLIQEQSYFHTAIGALRLLFIPVLVWGLAVGGGSMTGLAEWFYTGYIKIARLAYSALFVGISSFALFRDWQLLGFGSGFDVFLAMSGFGLMRGYQKRFWSWYDLFLSIGLAIVSLKRGALIGIVAILIVSIAILTLKKVRYSFSQGGRISRVEAGIIVGGLAVGAVFALGLSLPQFDDRTEDFAELAWEGNFEVVSIRAEETRETFEVLSRASVIEQLSGHGAGYRFTKGIERTGALHNSYLTWLVLGGLIWLGAFIGLVLLGLRSSASDVQMKVGLIVLLMTGFKGNMALNVVFAVLIGYSVTVRPGFPVAGRRSVVE